MHAYVYLRKESPFPHPLMRLSRIFSSSAVGSKDVEDKGREMLMNELTLEMPVFAYLLEEYKYIESFHW